MAEFLATPEGMATVSNLATNEQVNETVRQTQTNVLTAGRMAVGVTLMIPALILLIIGLIVFEAGYKLNGFVLIMAAAGMFAYSKGIF